MIIPSLINYYNRLAGDPDSNVAPYGWSRQKVTFKVVIDASGKFKSIGDMRNEETIGKKKALRAATLTVPGSEGRTSKIQPRFLCDKPEYLLGLSTEEPDSTKGKARIHQCFAMFRERHLGMEKAINDEHYSAVCAFLREWDPDRRHDLLATIAEYMPGFGVFEVSGHSKLVHDRPRVKMYWNELSLSVSETQSDTGIRSPSLVTGEEQPIARLHEPKIKGVKGKQAEMLFFSVNKGQTAFESYGKQQGFNAPVGERDAFAYCTALNYLLEDKTRRVTIGEDTYVVWAERPVPFEQDVADLMGNTAPTPGAAPSSDEAGEAEDRDRARLLHDALQSIREGKGVQKSLGDANVPFYILGLSPNAARLHVRYWLKTTLGELAKNLAHHFAALELDGEPPGYRPPSIRDIVGETLPSKDKKPDHERADKGLATQILRAVLTGGRYPDRLLAGVIERVRAEGFAYQDMRYEKTSFVKHRRASIIRSFLSRNMNMQNPIGLDLHHPEKSYHCGRLLAVIDFAQSQTMKDANSTVVRRNLGGIMSAPGLVLPRLVKLAHISYIPKLKPDASINRFGEMDQFVEDLVGSIMERLGGKLPTSLNLQDQGVFLLGFYQQARRLEEITSQIKGGHLYRTTRGDWVRSKGERQVAECLLKIGVPYTYEPRVMFGEGPDRFPDFVVLGSEPKHHFYIEYVGGARQSDQSGYNDRWEAKKRQYALEQITPAGGENGRLIEIDARDDKVDDKDILLLLEPIRAAISPNRKTNSEQN